MVSSTTFFFFFPVHLLLLSSFLPYGEPTQVIIDFPLLHPSPGGLHGIHRDDAGGDSSTSPTSPRQQHSYNEFDGLDNDAGDSFPPRAYGCAGNGIYAQIDRAGLTWFNYSDGTALFSLATTNITSTFSNTSECAVNEVISPRILYHLEYDFWVVVYVASSLRSLCIATMGDSTQENASYSFLSGVAVQVAPSTSATIIDGERFGASLYEADDMLAFGFDLYDASSFTFRYIQSAVMGVQMSTLNQSSPILGEDRFDFHKAALNQWSPIYPDTNDALNGALYLRMDYFGDDQKIDVLELWRLNVNWGNPLSATFSFVQQFDEDDGWISHSYWAKGDLLPAHDDGTINVQFSVPLLGNHPRYRYDPSSERAAIVGAFHIRLPDATECSLAWFELSKEDGSAQWTLRQMGIVGGGDRKYRFNPSVTQDARMNIALGFSATSPSHEPDIRYTMHGESYHDASQMGGEVVVYKGGAHDPISSEWFVFSSICTDPGDNLTFLYMNEYYDQPLSGAWRSRIASFQWGVPSTDTYVIEAGLIGAIAIGATLVGLGGYLICVVCIVVVAIAAIALLLGKRRWMGEEDSGTATPPPLWSSDSESVVYAL